MWIISLFLAFALLLPAGPAAASPGQASSGADGQEESLPLDVNRIRRSLERAPAEWLKGLTDRPTFKVEVREEQRFQELLSTLEFKSGPASPGGLYGDETRRLWTPKGDQPLAQPYGAFSQKELIVVALEALLQRYMFARVVPGLVDAAQARADQEERERVERELSEFLAAHPDAPRPQDSPPLVAR
jgi:hypothetical protein